MKFKSCKTIVRPVRGGRKQLPRPVRGGQTRGRQSPGSPGGASAPLGVRAGPTADDFYF